MNEIAANSTIASPQLDLGKELLRCRRVSGARILRAQGYLFAWPLYYVLIPLLMLPYMALMATMMIFYIAGFSIEEMINPAFGVVLVVVYLGHVWFTYVWPRDDSFALYEKGVRIRTGFKRLAAPFDTIKGILTGRKPSTPEQVLRLMVGTVSPTEAEWLNRLDASALAFVMKDGKTRVFKTILTRFEPADLEKLFAELLSRNPQFRADHLPVSASDSLINNLA